jgi:hypothetical protein
MGLINPVHPDVDPDEFLARPFFDRIKYLGAHWVDHGFGTPRVVHLIYLTKIVVLYAALGLYLISVTSDVGSLSHFGDWWKQPIVYQKLVLWTMLLEVIGIAGTWGPLAGHFKPMTGAILYWIRPGTIRVAPWPTRVPFTAGDTRTVGDVLLYVAAMASLATAFALPGVGAHHLVRPAALVPILVLMITLGLRDKTIFLAARSEQYLPAIFFSTVLGYTDMMISFKMLIVSVWLGAGVSKIGRHFINVVPPMVANAPFMPTNRIARAHYRRHPDDLLPSKLAWFMAHVGGTFVEIVTPLVLLFTTNRTIALLGVIVMVTFHLFITSMFPFAVPLEWNIFFGYAAVLLFRGYPNGAGWAIWDMSSPWLVVGCAALLLFFPILGNLRPDLVAFLPSMRQYAGNWASATWALAPGCEQRINDLPIPARLQVEQLTARGFEPGMAEITVQLTMAWRSMHSQARGLLSLLDKHVDVDRYTIREAELLCNLILGWNFGDGHLHDERLIAAVQRRLNFAPGELVVVWVESQPIHKNTQAYRVIDAALGVVERGTWKVTDAVAQQPWLPNGPIPLDVTWTLPGHVPLGRGTMES